jgi:hypothetical protein
MPMQRCAKPDETAMPYPPICHEPTIFEDSSATTPENKMVRASVATTETLLRITETELPAQSDRQPDETFYEAQASEHPKQDARFWAERTVLRIEV